MSAAHAAMASRTGAREPCRFKPMACRASFAALAMVEGDTCVSKATLLWLVPSNSRPKTFTQRARIGLIRAGSTRSITP
jgi:hypothetical protein